MEEGTGHERMAVRASDGAGDHCGQGCGSSMLQEERPPLPQDEPASSSALEKVLEVGSCHKQKTSTPAAAEVRGGCRDVGQGENSACRLLDFFPCSFHPLTQWILTC